MNVIRAGKTDLHHAPPILRTPRLKREYETMPMRIDHGADILTGFRDATQNVMMVGFDPARSEREEAVFGDYPAIHDFACSMPAHLLQAWAD